MVTVLHSSDFCSSMTILQFPDNIGLKQSFAKAKSIDTKRTEYYKDLSMLGGPDIQI